MPDRYLGTSIKGYSGTWYPGNYSGNIFNPSIRLHIRQEHTYLYHGNYNDSIYGMFYLSIAQATEYPFMSVGSNTLYGIEVSSPDTIANLVNSEETSRFFDILPESWKSNLLSRIGSDVKYTLCFVAQSDIEEFLNTYWKYEGGN